MRPLKPSNRFGPAGLLRSAVGWGGLWAMAAAACLTVGSDGRIGWPSGEVLPFRREAVLLASLVGFALSVSGVAYQATLRNPLAEPYLLGVSAGAALAAYVWTLGGAWMDTLAGAVGQQAFAFAGAAAAVAAVFVVAGRHAAQDRSTLILAGVIVNAVCGSVFLLIHTLRRTSPQGGDAAAFLVGRLQTHLTLTQITLAASLVGAGTVLLAASAGRLNAAGLSDDEAASLGVRPERLRWVTLVVASAVAAAAVAVSGPIGFVGLICPHLARRIVGHDVRVLWPAAGAAGAILLCVADAGSRGLYAPGLAGTYLPIGVITGLLGGPFFLLLLRRRRREGDGGHLG